MYCVNCGEENIKGTSFCGYCGKPLGVSKGNNKTGKIAPKKRCSPRVKRSREKRKLIRRMIFVIIVTILATSAGFISYNLVINSIQL